MSSFVKEQEKLFIIFTHQLNYQSFTEVEFSSKNATERVPGTLENEYTISVTTPGKYLRNRVSFKSILLMMQYQKL